MSKLDKFFDGIHGVIFPFAGASAPAGFLMCDGSAVSRTTFAALFTAIGTAFGVGDGSTTFNVPDLRGRTLAGKDNMGGTAANRLTVGNAGFDATVLGNAGGDERMHAHAHTGEVFNALGTVGASGHVTQAGTGGSAGAGNSQNVQPTAIINWIVKT